MGLYGKYERVEDIPEEERKYYYIMDKFRPLEEIEWVDQLVNGRWTVRLPKFLADYHSWWPIWEKECHDSMAELLKPGMLLYDVGAFDGWQSAMFAQMVGGGENMVLVEPVTEMWANTKATWEQNGLFPPRASFIGFAGDYDTQGAKIWPYNWPIGPDYSQIIKAIKFKLMHEHGDCTECIKLDTLAYMPNFDSVPDALHIDVEGAGLKVLKGAKRLLQDGRQKGLLQRSRPLVWIALHPQFMRERFQTEPDELHEFMREMRYSSKLLAVDHEEHWLFTPND
jgi:FkbM family methyltransferase